MTNQTLLKRALKTNFFYLNRGIWLPSPGLDAMYADGYPLSTEERWITSLATCPVGVMEMEQEKLGKVFLSTSLAHHFLGPHSDYWEYFLDLDMTGQEMGFKPVIILANDFTRSQRPVKYVACPDEITAIAYSAAMENLREYEP